jgi:hypothetical protein
MEVGMESRWTGGIGVGTITGALAFPMAGTIWLLCTGDVLYLYYESYALPAIALQGGVLGALVSPLVIMLLGKRKTPVTVARLGAAAVLGAVSAMSLAVFVIALLTWSDGAIADLLRFEDMKILVMPCMAGAAGFVIGGVLAMRPNRMKTSV